MAEDPPKRGQTTKSQVQTKGAWLTVPLRVKKLLDYKNEPKHGPGKKKRELLHTFNRPVSEQKKPPKKGKSTVM